MDLKLEKKEDRYDLYDESTGQKIASNLMQGNGAKLSTKNCEAVFNGYDLDEFIEKIINESCELHLASSKIEKYIRIGFQKALSIREDKKFSEEDLRLAIHFGQFGEANDKTTTIGFIQSLQQKSWDVEIVTEPVEQAGENVWHNPKLDANGCIILRRKK